MIKKTIFLSELLKPLNAKLLGNDVCFSEICTDSRIIKPNQLFIALKGKNFDGHNYLDVVKKKGGIAALIDHDISSSNINLPKLLVNNTYCSLAKIGKINRNNFSGHVIAVTGSNGKTTVKEMLASIIRLHFGNPNKVLATDGNMNNLLGVSLTLAAISAENKIIVVELGASHIGDITETVNLVSPSLAIITNIGNAHIGTFGGINNIKKAKSEILNGLSPTGTIILNLDDKHTFHGGFNKRTVLSFSLTNNKADVYAKDIFLNEKGYVSFRLKGLLDEQIQLPFIGKHNVVNALAASLAAYYLKIPLLTIVSGLKNTKQMRGRLYVLNGYNKKYGGIRIIDDSYNSNPLSMKAAIDTLVDCANGKTILILGEMSDLGDLSEKFHCSIGSYAKGKISKLYAIGRLTQNTVNLFGIGGKYFTDNSSLLKDVIMNITSDTTILIKGSHSSKMYKIVNVLYKYLLDN